MKTWTFPEYRVKPEAGSGPWDDEPDKAQWVDPATGLDCLILRHHSAGHLCGYVGVPPGHPCHGLDYDDAHETADGVAVHGGLTFAGPCQEQPENRGICHVPEPGRPENVWWLGFDCAHAGDVSPNWQRRLEEVGIPATWNTYKTFDYVKSECTDLARQLAAVVAQ